ncbi:uncharacterized protein J3D65DRAFT_637713 [Phyllosticta citribraziliensis]|uniref:Uncharacterized protein n=1 Tax=Phyllosticta citribraziliensis TaxID=989973 RepID=A0ABR1LC90_9PEZI
MEYLEKDTQWKAESLFVTEKMLQKLKRARPLGPKFCRIWSEMMQAGTSNAVVEDKKLAGFELELVAAWLFASSLRGTGATYSGWLERTVKFAQDFAMFPESIDKAREQNLEAELLVTHALREVTGNQYSLINITTRDQLHHVTNMARYRKMVIEKFSNSVDKRFKAIWRKAEKAQLKEDKAQWKKNKTKAQSNPIDPGADTNEKGEEEERPGEAEVAYQAQLSADSQRALEGLARLGLA